MRRAEDEAAIQRPSHSLLRTVSSCIELQVRDWLIINFNLSAAKSMSVDEPYSLSRHFFFWGASLNEMNFKSLVNDLQHLHLLSFIDPDGLDPLHLQTKI